MERLLQVRDLQALLDVLDASIRYVDTTIEADTIFALAEALQGMSVEDVEFVTLPGDDQEPRPGQPWYYIYDEAAAATLFYNIKNYCSVLSPEEQAAEKAKQELEDTLSEVEGETGRSDLDLAVLNGVRWEGKASQVAGILEGKGYADVTVGNTVNAYEETTVYYNPGYDAEARMVARDLDPDATYVLDEDADVAITYDADVILVIGKDYVND
jgi:hypothetical protein